MQSTIPQTSRISRALLASVFLMAAVIFCLGAFPAPAQTSNDQVWEFIDQPEPRTVPTPTRRLRVNSSRLNALLDQAPAAASDSDTILSLPWPDGSYRRLRVNRGRATVSGVVNYEGVGVDDASLTMFAERSADGFFAKVIGGSQMAAVHPVSSDDSSLYETSLVTKSK